MVEAQIRRRKIVLGRGRTEYLASPAQPYLISTLLCRKARCALHAAGRAIQTRQYEHVAPFCEFSSSHHLHPSMREVRKLSAIVS